MVSVSARTIELKSAFAATSVALPVNPGWVKFFNFPTDDLNYTLVLLVFCACMGFVFGGLMTQWGRWASWKYVMLALFAADLGIALLIRT